MRTNEELIAAYRAGEASALNELAKQNRGLIAVHANDWARDSEWDDVFQECSLAFLLAAHAFDPSRGKRFSTLASVSMNNHMRNLRVRNGAQKRVTKLVRNYPELRDRGENPAIVVERRLDAAQMLSLIPCWRNRKIMWLKMNGYTNPEIGKRAGVTLQRAEWIVRNERNRIRELAGVNVDDFC